MSLDEKVTEAMKFLLEKGVLEKDTVEAYRGTRFFDFVFRGHLACLLQQDKNPEHYERNVELAVMQSLEHFRVSETLEYMKFLHDIIRTMQSDIKYEQILELLSL